MYTDEIDNQSVVIKSIGEIIELAKVKNGTEYFNVWMWRGQSNIKWKLHSSAYRRLSKDNKNITEKDLSYYEESLLTNASTRGYRFYNGRKLNDFELLTRLQHHGAATRLVDFSRNILIAIWFAVCDNPNCDGVVFGFHSSSLGGYEEFPEEDSYEDFIKGIEEIDHCITFQAPQVAERVFAQSSQFLYSKITNDERGSLAFSEDEHLLIIKILKEDKSRIKKDLIEFFDIRHDSIFPDIDGFGQANSSINSRDEMYRW